jgi:hypothetical protein
LGWDLTYETVLKKNNVVSSEVVLMQPGGSYQSPVLSLLENWKGGTIISSILVEFPAEHGSAHGVLWLIRTDESTYYRLMFTGMPFQDVEGELEPVVFADILNSVMSWHQYRRKEDPSSFPLAEDYWGFLSIYDGKLSRQLLLTSEDFVLSEGDSASANKPGRVAHILVPFVEKARVAGNK